MALFRSERRQQGGGLWRRLRLRRGVFTFTSRKLFRIILIALAFIAIFPPIFFHFKLRRFHQVQFRKCGWLSNPPLVCAHGGDSSKAFPNTIAAYQSALRSQVDCIEIDVSRSSDGVLFSLHDSLEDALNLVSGSVRQVILDAKVGPPSFERGLAKDILSVVERTPCRNCVVWAKSDNLARDVMRLSSDVTVGYIVMIDPSTGARTNLLRMRGAGVVGVYHPLIDEKLVKILHRTNKKVYAWTVDDEVSMRQMLHERVDAIVTGNPTLLQGLMQDIRTQCLEEGFSSS